MNAPESQTALRPLGLGEILDRAVTLCVRYFVPFATIYVVFAVPFAVVNFFATRNLQPVLRAINETMTRAAASGKPVDQAEVLRTIAHANLFDGWTAAALIGAILVAPLPIGALIEATAERYLGREIAFAQAYRVGFARWMPLVGVNVLCFFAALVAYLGIVVVTVAIALAFAFLAAALHGVGIVLSVLAFLILGLAAIAFALVATLAVQMAYFTCVVERAAPFAAVSTALRRVFVGVGLRRSLLVGAAFLAIGIGIGLVASIGQGLIFAMLHNDVVGAAYATILRVATAAFTTAFMAIFYFDLRVREEGLDLALEAERARAHSLETA